MPYAVPKHEVADHELRRPFDAGRERLGSFIPLTSPEKGGFRLGTICRGRVVLIMHASAAAALMVTLVMMMVVVVVAAVVTRTTTMLMADADADAVWPRLEVLSCRAVMS